ncbi:Cytochrome P450 monooxygenase FUM15 [Drechslerella dactyloides]|uniref:Cytochrome P450 monooxygenase FUM15 n=1 Tax=Drechslerella dactyloides TaxID=74499 RepID=A0AAD6NFH6_DREDA|nr:Cytochrome P450 monooxygenase FUM15 [Drechslerella dactyloides]
MRLIPTATAPTRLTDMFLQTVVLSLAESYVLVRLSYLSAVSQNTNIQFLVGAASLILLQSVAYGIYHWIIYPIYFSPLLGLPEPKAPSFWNGHGKEIVIARTGAPQKVWMREVPNDGLILYKGIMNRERLMPTSPKVLAEVLTSKSYTFVKPRLFQFALARLLGNGLLMAEGDEHKRQRKILTPAFHPRHLRSLFPLFWSKSVEMVRLVSAEVEKAEVDDPVIDFNSWGSRCTLDIIGKAAAGVDFQAMTDPNGRMLQVYRKVFQPSTGQQWLGILNMFLPPWFMRRLPLPAVMEITAARNVIMKICEDIIRTKKVQMAEKKEMHPDILSIMMEDGGLTDEEMKNQLMTFMAAGHETTAAAVSWSCYELARRPDIAERLRDAIREAIPDGLDDESINMDTIDNIRYLRNFCNEILRFHPPVPVTLREAGKNATLNGHFIPENTAIMLVPAAINLSPEFWGPDADEFNPDRWDKEGGAGGATSNYGNMTFLMGPRSCIGQKFSIEEFRALIACIAGTFAFEEETKDMEITVRGGITQRPVHNGGLPLKTRIVPGW